MRSFCVSLAGLLLICAACGASGKVKGRNPKGKEKTVLAIRAGDAGKNIVLTGTITEKCPTAGCWFWLTDATGAIRVDTKNAKFVVTDIPLNHKVTVGGDVTDLDGEAIVQATGIRY